MSAKKKGVQREDFKQEDVLLAVVIADSFNVRFSPISQEKPRALLPLVNVALLDYTLEFLCSAGLEQVIVFCRVHAEQIKEHIKQSKWSRETSPCDIITIVSEDCRSLGDALRDIDAKGIIKSDFVLVNGDVVSNLKLKPLIEEHKARHLKLKTPVMTMLFKHAPPGHRTRCREEEVMLAVRPEDHRVLHYEKVGTTKKFHFPLAMFQENKDVQLRYDLLDTHISICSPVVPCLFTDEFDYLTRDDFVRGILVNEEILGNTIHVSVLEDDYAARVSNLQMYDAISKDVMERWSYPLVPDGNISNMPENYYTYGRHNIYLHRDVTLARGCVLEEQVTIGKGSVVGSNTRISHSVIGKDCHIGDSVLLEGAYVWDSVTIGDGCTVKSALIADKVQLLPNVTVNPGCVISSRCVVGPDVQLTEGLMLMAEPPKAVEGDLEDDFNDLDLNEKEVAAVLDPGTIGQEGVAYVYNPATESDEELDDVVHDRWGLATPSEDDLDMSDGESDSDDEGSLRESPVADDAKLFYDEVIGTLERALEENIGFDNMVLEINSLKHAYNIQIKEVNQLVTSAICELPLRKKATLQPNQYFTQFKSIQKKIVNPLLRNYAKSKESQLDSLTAMEDLSMQSVPFGGALIKVLQLLYDEEVLSEEAILEWHSHLTDTADNLTDRQEIRKKVEPFIQWLQEAEEESDSDNE